MHASPCNGFPTLRPHVSGLFISPNPEYVEAGQPWSKSQQPEGLSQAPYPDVPLSFDTIANILHIINTKKNLTEDTTQKPQTKWK